MLFVGAVEEIFTFLPYTSPLKQSSVLSTIRSYQRRFVTTEGGSTLSTNN
jgi:hypothetical protein